MTSAADYMRCGGRRDFRSIHLGVLINSDIQSYWDLLFSHLLHVIRLEVVHFMTLSLLAVILDVVRVVLPHAQSYCEAHCEAHFAANSTFHFVVEKIENGRLRETEG